MDDWPSPSEIPDLAGVYVFRDRHGAVMYVGKAKSIRKRLSSYFRTGLAVRTRAMVEASAAVDWIVASSEEEAIMLEYNLIQKEQPRFNIRLKDDKSFPYLALTRSEEWPRAVVMRGKKRKGTQYFGPYARAYAIRQTLDLLVRTFPVRTCSNAKFRRHEQAGRPCLLFHIERCSGPCVGEVTPEEYAAYVDGLAEFLQGDQSDAIEELRQNMEDAADDLLYEQAARFRDQLTALERASGVQEMVSNQREDFDLIALHDDDLEAALAVMHVRNGRVVGRIATIIDKVEDVTTPELITRMIAQLYGSDPPPPVVLVQELPPDVRVWERWLTGRRSSNVTIRVPARGAKARLMETAQANAREEFARHRLRRQSDHNARARALRSLQEHLDLPEAPLRIECYDISTVQGTSTVGSMVVLEDGLPRTSDYRHFRIKTVEGQDDFASMEEVLHRRFSRYLEEMKLPIEERGRFAYPPSLVLVDGGPGQVSSAVKALGSLGLDIPIAGLAKRMEEVYLPGRAEPVRIPRGEDALYLLQRIRDEAHRFAVTYHRKIRGKSMVDSILDEVPGVGPTRKRALVRRFKSVKKMREAPLEELAEVVPQNVAINLYAALH